MDDLYSKSNGEKGVGGLPEMPAQPTGAVSNSLRALSEAASALLSACMADMGPLDEMDRDDEPVGMSGFGVGTAVTFGHLRRLERALASHPAGQSAGTGAEGWLPIETAPRDGSKFDAWAVDPSTGAVGVRFTDVQMRGDGSGFGVVIHRPDAHWEYLEQGGPTFPAWKLTHWRRPPTGPGKPAPDSTRTGQGEAEEKARRIVHRLLARHFERTSANSDAATEAAIRDLAVLAARPAAPEAQGAEREGFNAGYAMACANIVNLHGEDTIAEDVLAESGITLAEVKALGLTDYDMKPLRALFREIARKRKISKARPAPPASSGQE